MYVCPLCTNGYGRDALDDKTLTLEHAPPESLGGRPVCLTCKPCNNDAGRGVDAHMKRRDNVHRMMAGTMDDFRPIIANVGAASVHANFYNGPGGILLFGVPRANPPASNETLQAELARAIEATQNFRFGVTAHRDEFDNWLATIGWLRSAYLIAFAVFGYAYIFQNRLRAVRDQLAAPEAKIIHTFSIYLPQENLATNQCFIVDEPAPLRSLAVRMGRQVVLLPFVTDGLYEELAARSQISQNFEVPLTGRPLPWPNEPMHLMDFDCVRGITRTSKAPA